MQNVLYISYIESIHPIRTIRRSSALPHMGMRYIIASIRILSSGSSSSSVWIEARQYGECLAGFF